MKNYKQTAADVVRLVGGDKNVTHLEHCSTRLRFTLADPGKADTAALKKTPGVMGVVASGPQCQVVIGNDVIEVYNELMKLGSFNNGAAEAPKAGGKKDFGAIALDFVVGIFQPLVPAIAGAGMIKALLALCTTLGLMTTDTTAYLVLYYVADAALYYLPLMVAYTTASKLNANKFVALALAGAMIFPNTTTLLATEGGARLFGFTLQSITYTSQVFPSILCVSFMALVERWITKISPKPIRVFFVPMVSLFISFPVALLILGPLGYNLGTLLTTVVLGMYSTFGWVAVAVLGAILPFMIATGMHKALLPYAIPQFSNPGYEILYMGATLAHNISEGGACLAVAVKTKNENLRSTAISAGISALCGITEPALYGVTLQHKRAMGGVCIGSFISGLFIGLMKIKGFVPVTPCVVGMVAFIDPENSMNLIYACIGLVIAIVASFVATFILFHDAEEDAPAPAAAAVPASPSAPAAGSIASPLQGSVVPLNEVKDEVFATGVLGEGIAVLPTRGELFAPADGTIENVFDTKHAISMVTANGAELLMHVGLDTVQLEGKGYNPQVKSGDPVRKGQLLLKFDLDGIKAAGYDPTTPVIVTNADQFNVTAAAGQSVEPGAPLLKLDVKA